MDALGKLGIDVWGLLLYLVNFGVLLLLMHRFVYKPLLKMLDERKDRIKEDVETATEIREQLERERGEEEQMRKARLQELDGRVSDAKALAREEAKRTIGEAEAQRDAILSQASKSADQVIASTINDAEQEILARVQQVVTHVLQDGVPKEVVEKSVKDSWSKLTRA